MGLLSKLISAICGKKSAPKSAAPAGKPRRPAQGKSRTARPERSNAPADASARPPRSHSAKPRRPRPEGGHAPASTDRSSNNRPRREGSRPPRRDARPEDRGPRNTNAGEFRPGGAFTPEQLKANAAEHAAWDPASYVVPAVEGKTRFADLGLPSEILHAVASLGFEYCTPIQAQSLEFSLAGKNVAGRAQTGTGKTAAFLIAVLTRYLRTPEKRNLTPGTPRALIIAPTRELVIQICKDAEALGKYCGDVRSLAVYGGMDYDRQRRELEVAPVDLLVATPGRLLDFVRNRIVDLRQIDTLVIDEADRMLDMGFIPDVRAIINRLPDRDNRCTMLYSATLNETVMRLASMWMREPVRVEIEAESLATDTVHQLVYIARADEKFKLLYNTLAKYADVRSIIFCNRKSTTERVCDNLRRYGIPCEMLSGDVNQIKRLKILDNFRAGKIRTVVATDVAGRGIHVDDIAFVFNFDFPYEPEDYVHRIGRTGRAGHTGTAISFADEDESFIIPDIEKYINEPLKCVMPEEWMLADLPAAQPKQPRQAPRAQAPAEAPAAEAPAAEAPAAEAPAAPVAETPVVEAPVPEETPAPEAPAFAPEAPVAEVKPEVKAEPAPEAKPEVKAEVKPEAKPAAKPAAKAPAKPAAPAKDKAATPKAGKAVRPAREPKFRPRSQKNAAQPNRRPPRQEKPTAEMFLRTQADGPRDGSESHHAAAIVHRPIYTPGKQGPVADEWRPGQ